MKFDIAWGAGFIWATLLDVPLTAIDTRTNKILRQLRFYDSVWLTDYKRRTLSRVAYGQTLK